MAALFFSVLIAASQSAFAFEFAQGVIVDGARSLVYVMNREGDIDEVALSGGAVLASTTRGAKPLLLNAATLLAQAVGKDGVLSLVGLKTKDLEPAFTVDVPLPSGVQASVSDCLGASFYVSARMDGDVIIVQWRSMQRAISAVPTREPGHVSAGLARIDPGNGRLIASGGGRSFNSRKRQGGHPRQQRPNARRVSTLRVRRPHGRDPIQRGQGDAPPLEPGWGTAAGD
jgi:hypothetical protein